MVSIHKLHSDHLYQVGLLAKCPQLDSNVIAYNLKKKMGLRHFPISHNTFTYNWPPSWTPS